MTEEKRKEELNPVDCSTEIKHPLEYSMWSAKVSWCPICHAHFYNKSNESGGFIVRDDHYHIFEE